MSYIHIWPVVCGQNYSVPSLSSNELVPYHLSFCGEQINTPMVVYNKICEARRVNSRNCSEIWWWNPSQISLQSTQNIDMINTFSLTIKNFIQGWRPWHKILKVWAVQAQGIGARQLSCLVFLNDLILFILFFFLFSALLAFSAFVIKTVINQELFSWWHLKDSTR